MSEFTGRMRALRYVQDVTMVNIPVLKKLILRFAFVGVSELEMENASLLESYKELGELKRKQDEEKERRRREEEEKKRREEERRRKEEERKKKEEEERKRREEEERLRKEKEKKERREKGIVLNAEELNTLPVNAKKLWVKKCEDYQNEVLDLSRFAELEALTIGDECFNYVSKVSVVGLKKLKSVAIGAKSFQNESNDSELIVSDCPELMSLSIGNESFKGFKEMKVSEVKALKTITIGDECFKDCDLVLKDLKSVESVVIGVNSFEKSRHSVVGSANYSRK